jgi:tellurite resistance-related uncharacterized protein
MMKLPESTEAYKKTPVFTNDTVPSGLLKTHTTKKGTWGKIVVLKGVLKYVIETDPAEEIVLSQEKYGVVEPEVPHHVMPQGEVEFYVEFYK